MKRWRKFFHLTILAIFVLKNIGFPSARQLQSILFKFFCKNIVEYEKCGKEQLVK